MRHALALFVALAGASAQMPVARAGEQDFTLINRTGYQIDEVYVSRSSSRNWGEDIMGSDSLDNGHFVKVNFRAPANACEWDLRVKYNDGDEATWNSLNLCEVSKVTLFWDKKTQNTRAVTE